MPKGRPHGGRPFGIPESPPAWDRCRIMRIAITGSSGLIGTALSSSLRAGGHDVLRLVRRPTAAPDEITWDPANGTIDTARLEGVDAVVNLAGAGLGDRRWNAAYKREILTSRTAATHTIARAVAEARVPVLVSGSAIGFYGDTGDRAVTEADGNGSGFLADVVVAWEAAAGPARDGGTRVVLARTGLVATREGGAFGRMLPLFRLGLGGRLGSGRQYWSLISLRDEVRALEHCITSDVEGPVNCTAPSPGTNAAFTSVLARALHRPALLPVPAFALRTVVGEFAGDILGSQRVEPARLLASGFRFEHADVSAIAATLR